MGETPNQQLKGTTFIWCICAVSYFLLMVLPFLLIFYFSWQNECNPGIRIPTTCSLAEISIPETGTNYQEWKCIINGTSYYYNMTCYDGSDNNCAKLINQTVIYHYCSTDNLNSKPNLIRGTFSDALTSNDLTDPDSTTSGMKYLLAIDGCANVGIMAVVIGAALVLLYRYIKSVKCSLCKKANNVISV